VEQVTEHGDDRETRVRLWFWRTWTVIGVVALLWAVAHVFAAPIRLLFPPIALAAILVYLLNPVVTTLQRRGLHRVVGTTVAYLVLGGVLVGLSVLVFPVLARQTTELLDRIPDIAVALQETVNDQLRRLGVSQRITLDPEATSTQTAIEQFLQDNQDQVLGLLRGAGALVAGLVAGLVAIILAPVLAFYVLVDLPRLSDGVRRLVPPRSRTEVVDVTQRILRTVGAYVRGQLLVATFVAVATTIGLVLIGLPFYALVGVIAGAFNLIPFVGPFAGGVIGAVIALTVGNGLGQAVAVVVVMTVVQQIDNHVITPGVLSRTVHVHPVTIILSLAVAASMFGLLGMLVVIPLLAAAKLVVMYLLVTRVPSMAHLAGEGPEVIDGVPVGEVREASLVGMGRELRGAWESLRRRRQEGAPRGRDPDAPAGPSAHGAAHAPDPLDDEVEPRV
jgi:predicted PurR-regulated permease PerM